MFEKRGFVSSLLVMVIVLIFGFGLTSCKLQRSLKRRGQVTPLLQGEITEEELEAYGIAPSEAARGMEFVETSYLDNIYFEYNQSNISGEAKEMIEKNAAWLQAHPRVKVMIEGHCDERGTEEYNLALGERRSTSVRKYLAILGVNPARLYTISYGESLPVDMGHNEGAWAKNRRVHFKIKVR